jgi:hypothetical protein
MRKTAILISGKFKLGAFSPAAGTPAAGENRAFRGCALSRSGHIAPRRGRRVLLRNPYNRLRYIKAFFAVKVDADFRFEIGIAVQEPRAVYFVPFFL